MESITVSKETYDNWIKRSKEIDDEIKEIQTQICNIEKSLNRHLTFLEKLKAIKSKWYYKLFGNKSR